MRVGMLDLQAQHRTTARAVEAAVLDVLRSGRYILGRRVIEFESVCASRCGVARAVGVSSGTDALLMALMALDVGPGDEVVTTAFSFFATAGVIHRLGARPVFVDIDLATFNIDPGCLDAAISARTKAIIVVHLFGQCADMEAILRISDARGVPVIEDAAQAFGASRKGRPAGGMGLMGCFSFFPSKNLGAAGDAGMVVTDDCRLADRLAQIRDHGARPKYFHPIVGGNFRLDEIQAAILLAKLEYLPGWIQARRAHAQNYFSCLAGAHEAGQLVLPGIEDLEGHVFNQFTVRFPGIRDDVAAALEAAEIGHAIYYPRCLHLQECFRGLGGRPGDCPNAELAASEVLSLPVYPELSDANLESVSDAVLQALSGRR